jgi:hypothetical protein
MELTERLDRSRGTAREVLAPTTPDHYELPTPCADWDQGLAADSLALLGRQP